MLISHVDKQSATECGREARPLATDLSRHACGRCVCARLSPNLIAPDHLQGLLAVAAEEAGDKEDSTYLTAVLDLLVGCSVSAPALFAKLGNQVWPLTIHPIDMKWTYCLLRWRIRYHHQETAPSFMNLLHCLLF